MLHTPPSEETARYLFHNNESIRVDSEKRLNMSDDTIIIIYYQFANKTDTSDHHSLYLCDCRIFVVLKNFIKTYIFFTQFSLTSPSLSLVRYTKSNREDEFQCPCSQPATELVGLSQEHMEVQRDWNQQPNLLDHANGQFLQVEFPESKCF